MVVTLRKTKPVENGLQLTQEELDQLYEEPEIVTTNALKAVLHYIPRDDSRICQHYDERTGRCFKGNSCNLEHVAPLKGEWILKKFCNVFILRNKNQLPIFRWHTRSQERQAQNVGSISANGWTNVQSLCDLYCKRC